MAVKTYECHTDYIGDYSRGMPIAPVGHIITEANIVISLDEDGAFLGAEKAEKGKKIIIPASEESAGRAGILPKAHPLCDQLSYLADYNEIRHTSYMEALGGWAASEFAHPFLMPVLTYIKHGTILKDLSEERLITLNEKGQPDSEKLLVAWHISGDGLGDCWTNRGLFESFANYYASVRSKDYKDVCMVSGEVLPVAKQHTKGVVPLFGNAKIISSNDSSGFTYRGRFESDTQALTVGYEASQKAHNALKWLIAEQGTYFGGRAFLCWNPQGKELKNPAYPFMPIKSEKILPTNYKTALLNSLASFKAENGLQGDEAANVAAFDAATTGRLSVTFYCEQTTADFLQRLINWDLGCCWVNGAFGVQAPPLWTIVNNAFGTQRSSNGKTSMEADEKISRQHMQRLIACKLGDGRISLDIVRALANRASTPQAYERKVWNGIIYTACAVLRKYRLDQLGEEWSMALDEQNTNRSYLFGRLLAIAEKVEQDTYDSGDERQTNAMKLMSVFSRRPLYAWRILEESLNPYYQRLRPASRKYYKKLLGEIVDGLSVHDAELDKPLEDVYLMGYYNQRQAFYKKKETENTENE